MLINNEHPVKRTLTDNEQKCKSSVCIDANFLFMYPLTSNKQAIKKPRLRRGLWSERHGLELLDVQASVCAPDDFEVVALAYGHGLI